MALPDEAGGAVDLDELAGRDPGRRAFDADDAGNAELARDDGGVRQKTAALDDDGRRVAEHGNPAGIGVACDEDLAGRERLVCRVAHDTRWCRDSAGAAADALPYPVVARCRGR